MNDDLVKFQISASFVAGRVTLRPDELKYGYERRWLDDAGVVGVAEAALVRGETLVAPMDELALLLSDDYGRIPELIAEVSDGPGLPGRVWLYLALAWVHANKQEFADPLGIVEMLYADFGYPSEIEGIVRYMPTPPGEASGLEAIEDRWSDYLARQQKEFSHRA